MLNYLCLQLVASRDTKRIMSNDRFLFYCEDFIRTLFIRFKYLISLYNLNNHIDMITTARSYLCMTQGIAIYNQICDINIFNMITFFN